MESHSLSLSIPVLTLVLILEAQGERSIHRLEALLILIAVLAERSLRTIQRAELGLRLVELSWVLRVRGCSLECRR